MAFLVLLERLGPEERAAFLLREVFGASYEEVARVLDKSETACRQLLHRARERVRGERARYRVPAETKERLIEQLRAALAADDREAVLALVAEEATFVPDGGGRVAAARKPIHGVERVARFLLGAERKWGRYLQHEVAWVNGEPTLVTLHEGRVFCTTSIETDGERILAFYRVLNPDKLTHVAELRRLKGPGPGEGRHLPL
jgi:RNA polymerase sigma-70 factor (ECF subfamily)